jgi:hypothetical protein
MLQFRFNRKLDPDGSKLHKLLEAQITYEQTSAFRSLYFHLLAILAVPIWLEVIWPDLFPSEIRLFILMLWGALLSLASWAAIQEYLSRRALSRRLSANHKEEAELTDAERLS